MLVAFQIPLDNILVCGLSFDAARFRGKHFHNGCTAMPELIRILWGHDHRIEISQLPLM